MYRLNSQERKNVLQDKDFNFDLGQEFLGSRHIAYQSKDLNYSLKNAKKVEKNLQKLNLDKNSKKSNIKS